MNIIPEKKMVKDDVVMEGKNKGMREVDPRPQFSINAEEFPELKNWSVGKKYMMEIEAEMVGSHIGEWGDDKGKMTASFKICGIKSESEEPGEDSEKEDDEYPAGMRKKK